MSTKAPKLGTAAVPSAEERAGIMHDDALRWDRVFRQAGFGLAHTRVSDNTFIEVNAVYASQRGYTPEDLAGQPVLTVYPPELRESIRQRFSEFNQSRHLVFETEHLRKDGSRFPVLVELTIICDASGQPVSRVAYNQDLSAKKQAEDALRISEQHFSTLASVVPVGIFRADARGKCLYVNERWSQITGIDPGRSLGDGWVDALHPEDRPRIFGAWQRCTENRSDFKQEYRFLRGDGQNIWVMGQASPIQDEAGRIEGWVGVITDISERMAHERRQAEEAARRQVLFDNSRDGIHVVDGHGCLVEANHAFVEGLGYGMVEMRSMHVWDWDAQYDREQLTAQLSELAGRSVTFETRHRHRDGSVIDVEISVSGVRVHGQTLFYCISRDISDRKAAEAQLRLAAKVFESSHEGILITDSERRIISVNAAFTQITGYLYEDVRGKNPRVLSSGRQSLRVYRDMWRTLKSRGYWSGEIWNRRKDGSIYPEWLGITAVENPAGEITNYVGIFSDITERKLIEEKIEYLAHHDALTGMPNRVLLEDRLAHALIEAARESRLVALLFIDLDRFKNINDSLGHSAGDALLQQVARRIMACVRESDTVSRHGGDEFLLVLPHLHDAMEVGHIARKILDQLSRPFDIESHQIIVSCSIGISIFPSDGTDFMALQRKADIAMYNAKEAGRNTYRFFTEQMNQDWLEKLLLENHLRQALDQDALSLAYQPQVDLSTGKIVGFEALVRWNHPERGPVSPAQFIPVAEESGLIIALGDWVLREACRQNRRWQEAGLPELAVAVNLSALQFRRENMVEVVSAVLEDTGLSARHLELELTESVLIQDADAALDTVRRLKTLGVNLSIDDFGTGYSSLAYLKRLAVDKLKIDQSFVQDLTRDADDAAIVSAIVQMARSLSLSTIAEGVETHAQAEALMRMGCHQLQGYFFARPMAAAEFERFFRDASGGGTEGE